MSSSGHVDSDFREDYGRASALDSDRLQIGVISRWMSLLISQRSAVDPLSSSPLPPAHPCAQTEEQALRMRGWLWWWETCEDGWRNTNNNEDPVWVSFLIAVFLKFHFPSPDTIWRWWGSCSCGCCWSRAGGGGSRRAPPMKERSGPATGSTESRGTRSRTRTPTAPSPPSSWSPDICPMTVSDLLHDAEESQLMDFFFYLLLLFF